MQFLPRAGSSLVELVMALSLTAIIVIAVTGLVTRQQRLYRALDQSLQTLPQRHDASALLGADIRTMATAMTPSAIASDSAFDIAATIGASTTCAPSTTTHLFIPPKAADASNTLTAWLSIPDSSDQVLIYRPEPQHWESVAISTVTSRAATVCTGLAGPFLDAAASEAPAYEITLTTPSSAPLRAGTPLRFVRYGRYNVYRASDGDWYIGYRHCTVTHSCDVVQPLVGPLGTGTTPAAVFRFFTPNGTAITPGTPLTNLARVDVVVRHRALLIPSLGTGTSATRIDSVITSIALRNHQ